MKMKKLVEELKAEINVLDKEIERIKEENILKESIMYDKGYKQCIKDIKSGSVYKGD